jgi:Glycosyl transferase family 2
MTTIERIETLASAVQAAPQRGFAGLVFDGFDLRTAMAIETDTRLLVQAFDIAQRAREMIWAEAFARQISTMDRGPFSRLRLASVLAAVGKCDEARGLVTEADATDELGRTVMGVLHAKTGQTDEAFKIFDTLPGGNNYHPAPIVLDVAQEILEQCEIACAMPFLQRLASNYPGHLLIRSLEMRCHLYAGDRDRVRDLAQLSDDALERAHPFDRRMFADAVAESLALSGWSNDVFDFARNEIAKDPEHWKLYFRAAVAARETAREREFSALIAGIPPHALDSAEALAVICRWHVDEGRREEGLPILEKLQVLSTPSFLDTRLYVAFEKCGLPLLGPVIAQAIHAYYYDCSAERFLACVTKLESLNCSASKNPYFWQTYLRCLVALGEEGRAETIYTALPRGLAEGEALGPFRMFFAAVHGRHKEAEDGWIKHIRATHHLCVNAPSSYPRIIQLKYAEVAGAVLLFTTLVNAGDYLDWFLAHYRAMGVNHFFIIDNGSTDGSIERLSKEFDVSLFSNRESFATAGFGVLWINHLLQQFGVGHWCFHVDVDEAFVFPGYGRGRSLQDLLLYCDQHGFRTVPSIELDMYPAQLDVRSNSNPFDSNCYFDVDYTTVRSELPPYIMVQGGVRKRLTKLGEAMQKSPLVRVTPDLRYVNCNHGTTHLPVSDVSGALLHYKFVGDAAARFEKALLRGEHFGGAISYRRLKSAVASSDQARGLLYPGSHRYNSPSTLEECGLIKSSALWEAFACNAGEGSRKVPAE